MAMTPAMSMIVCYPRRACGAARSRRARRSGADRSPPRGGRRSARARGRRADRRAHDHALALEAVRSSAPSTPSARQPQDVGLARRTSSPSSRSARGQARALGCDGGCRGRRRAPRGAQRLEHARLRQLVEAELGLELLEQRLGARAADGVAAAQAGEAPGLREGAEDEQPRVILERARARRRAARRRRSRAAPRRAARRRARAARAAARRSASRRSSSPVGSFGLHSATMRVRSLTAREDRLDPEAGDGHRVRRARAAP